MWLLTFFGCSSPAVVEVPPTYYIRFVNRVDSIYVRPPARDGRGYQVLELIQAETNLPDAGSPGYGPPVGWESDKVWFNMSAVNTLDTIPTINCCSYSYRGKVSQMFGAHTQLKGQVAKVIVSANFDGQLIADTMYVVIY